MKRQKTNDLVVIMKYRFEQGFLWFLFRTTFLDDITDHDRDHLRKYEQWVSLARMVVKLM